MFLIKIHLWILYFIWNDISQEEFGDTKGVIRIRKSKKDRQHNGHKNNDKQRSTKHTHQTNDRVARTPN